MAKIKPKDKPHYVNNREFSYAVVDYCTIIKEAKAAEKRLPVVTDYIAKCFLRIAEGLSHKSNFRTIYISRRNGYGRSRKLSQSNRKL